MTPPAFEPAPVVVTPLGLPVPIGELRLDVVAARIGRGFAIGSGLTFDAGLALGDSLALGT
jgi:hypothetical protein